MYTYLSWLFVECSEWKCTLICLGFFCSVGSGNVHLFILAGCAIYQVKMYTYLSWLFVECSEWKCTLICLGFLCSVKSWNVHSFNFAVWKGKQVKIKTLLTWLIINWTKWKYTLFKLNFCCSVISEMASVFLLNTLAWKLSEQRGEERPGEFGPSLKCQWSDVVFTYFSTLKSDKISHFTYFFTWLHLSTSPLPAKWCDGRELWKMFVVLAVLCLVSSVDAWA